MQLSAISLLGRLFDYWSSESNVPAVVSSIPGGTTTRVLRAMDECLGSPAVQIAALTTLQKLFSFPSERAALSEQQGVLRVLRTLDMYEEVGNGNLGMCLHPLNERRACIRLCSCALLCKRTRWCTLSLTRDCASQSCNIPYRPSYSMLSNAAPVASSSSPFCLPIHRTRCDAC